MFACRSTAAAQGLSLCCARSPCSPPWPSSRRSPWPRGRPASSAAKAADAALSATFDSYDEFWVGEDEVSDPGVGEVERTTGALYLAYGLRDDLDLIRSGAWVKAESDGIAGAPDEDDLQDLVLSAKWRAWHEPTGFGELSLSLLPGIRLPMTDYEDNGITAIGDGQIDLRARAVLHAQHHAGWYVALETGYDRRNGAPDDEFPLHLSGGATIADTVTVTPFVSSSRWGTNSMKTERSSMKWPVVALCALLAHPGTARAQEKIKSYPSAWSGASAPFEWLGDVDGDGEGDLVMGDTKYKEGPVVGELGRVIVQSCATGSDLYTYVGTQEYQALGIVVETLGDVSGDGIVDCAGLANSTAWFVWSAADGSELHQTPGYGSAIQEIGDFDGDGIGDFLLGKAGVFGGGQVLVHRGGSFSVAYTIPSPGWSGFGAALAALGDVNGDQVPDFAIGAPGNFWECSAGAVGTYSGADGSQIYALFGEAAGGLLGYALAAPGDFTGDGVCDLVVGAPKCCSIGDCKLLGRGRIYYHDGKTGAKIDTWDPGLFYGLEFLELKSAGDVNGNGYGDVLVLVRYFGGGWFSEVHLYDGGTRDLIYEVHIPDTIGMLGQWLRGVGDLDDDDFPDWMGWVWYVSFGIDPTIDLYSGAPQGLSTFGEACPTTAGDLPRIGASGIPKLGQPFSLHLTRVGPGLPAVLAVGASKSAWLGIPLPLDLAFVGLQGCKLHVALHSAVATATVLLRPGEGVATVTYSLPSDPALAGVSAYAQWLALDAPGSSPIGATTRGLEITFQ